MLPGGGSMSWGEWFLRQVCTLTEICSLRIILENYPRSQQKPYNCTELSLRVHGVCSLGARSTRINCGASHSCLLICGWGGTEMGWDKRGGLVWIPPLCGYKGIGGAVNQGGSASWALETGISQLFLLQLLWVWPLLEGPGRNVVNCWQKAIQNEEQGLPGNSLCFLLWTKVYALSLDT